MRGSGAIASIQIGGCNSLVRVPHVWFVLLFLALLSGGLGYAMPVRVAFAQSERDKDRLYQQLMELNDQLRIAGGQENHAEVERCMDRMIDLMERIGYSGQSIRDRAHLRIQYSMRVNRLKAAREAALAWLEEYPSDLVALDMLGTIYHRMALDEQARQVLKRVHEADPNHALKQRRYLEILMLTGDWREALKVCDLILETNADNVKSLIQVCEAFLQFGEPNRAGEVIERMREIAPAEPYVEYGHGQVLQAKGDFQAAAEVFASIPRDHPDWYNAQSRLGLCLLRLRKYQESARAFVEVLTVNPYDRAANARLDQALRRMRKREGANLLLRIRTELLENMETIEIESVGSLRRGDLAEYARLQAVILDDKRRYRDAEQLLIETCRTLPESLPAQENLAEHHLRTVQACRAEQIYRRLIGRVPAADRDRITVSLAKSLLLQGKAREPTELLHAASRESFLGRSLRSLLGTYYLEIEDDPTTAVSYLEGISSASPEVKAPLARAYLASGKIQEAWAQFKEIPGDYDDAVTSMAKVQCLVKLGQIDQAKRLFKQTINAQKDLSILITAQAQACLAAITRPTDEPKIMRRAHAIEESLGTVRELVVQANRLGWPNSIPILLKLSDTYAELGERGEALKYAQLALEGDPQRAENRRKVISLMTQPERLFERLHQIHILKSMDPKAGDFQKEISQALAHIQLVP